MPRGTGSTKQESGHLPPMWGKWFPLCKGTKSPRWKTGASFFEKAGAPGYCRVSESGVSSNTDIDCIRNKYGGKQK